jgi:hypothetical protein
MYFSMWMSERITRDAFKRCFTSRYEEGLVEHVAVRLLHGDDRDGEALQLAAGKCLDVAVEHVLQVQLGDQLVDDAAVVAIRQRLQNDSLHGFGDVVHVLRLDQCLDVIL